MRSGKTFFTKQLLQNSKSIFRPNAPTFVILVYETWQSSYDEIVADGLIDLHFRGLPDIEYLKEIFNQHKDSGGCLLIIDDLIQSIDESVTSIFTIYSHHLNVTCILLVQSLFLSSKEYRTISLNANYIILMKSVRNSSAVTQLAKQTHPYR